MNYTKLRQKIQAEIEYEEEAKKNSEYLDALKELNINVFL